MNGKICVVGHCICRETRLVNIGEIKRGEESRCEPCPLNRVKAGVAVRIKQLSAAPEIQNRLREIGLGEEQIIRLLTSQTNFICLVCNARLAISEQLASLIFVEPVTAPIKL